MSNLKQYLSASSLLAYPAAFVAGLLISFTPCVYPVIPIQLGFIGAQTATGHGKPGRASVQGFVLSLLFVIGMAAVYAALGAFASLTGTLFGVWAAIEMNVLKPISILGLILFTAAGFVGCSLSKGPMKDEAAQTTTGAAPHSERNGGSSFSEVAPNFQLTKIDGSPVSVSDLRGHPVVLIFWMAWCPVCKEEAPHFNELAARYEPRGVRVLGINIQDSEARARAGIKDFGIQYSVARDADASVARLYIVTGTPTVIFFDRQGLVRYTGNELPADYAKRLDTLLAEKA